MDKVIKNYHIFTGILLYILTGPFYTWFILRYAVFRLIIWLLVCFCFYKHSEINSRKNMSLVILFGATVLLYSITCPDWVLKAYCLISCFPIIFIPFSKSSFFMESFEVFMKIYVYLMSASIICWILVLLGLLPSIGSISGLIPELGDNAYDVYFFCVRQNVYDSLRFYGPYDEPGVVGTLSALLLILNRFNYKTKDFWVLMISGILSMSLFFFIIVILYVLFLSISEGKKKPLIVFLLLIPYVYQNTQENDELQWRVWRRFTIEDGQWVGDNRSNDSWDKIYESKKGTLEYWFGIDDWFKVSSSIEGGSSYKLIVMRNGMLFIILYCSFFILFGYKHCKRRSDFLFYSIVFISCLYQRPNIYDPVYVFVLCYLARFYGAGYMIIYKTTQ